MITVIKDKTKKNIILKIDKSKKRIEYFINKKSSQYKYAKKVILNGFEELPTGFYKGGFGFATGGFFILSELKSAFGENCKIIVEKEKPASVAKTAGGKYKVSLRHSDLATLMKKLKEVNAEKNELSKKITKFTMNAWFPNNIPYKGGSPDSPFVYTEDKISRILNSDSTVLTKLSKADVDKLFEIYPTLVKTFSKTVDFSKKIVIAKETKQENEKLYLEALIAEFEERLKKTTSTEREWQEFLKKNILVFNTAYVRVIEGMNISLSGKYPDFLLIDVYGFIDVFEIKKPNTNLMKQDDSRNNFYWDTEISKGISQTENYLHTLKQDSRVIQDEIKRQRGHEVNVVRPRGIIIAGIRSQLKNEKMRDDFKILSSSMKDIEVILYDDLLNNLKNLYERLGGNRKKKAGRVKFKGVN